MNIDKDAELKLDQIIRIRVIEVLNKIMNDITYQQNLCAKQVIRNYYDAEMEIYDETEEQLSNVQNN